MIAALKEQAARFVVRKKLRLLNLVNGILLLFYLGPIRFLVMMPAKESDFRFVFPILEYLREQRKILL